MGISIGEERTRTVRVDRVRDSFGLVAARWHPEETMAEGETYWTDRIRFGRLTRKGFCILLDHANGGNYDVTQPTSPLIPMDCTVAGGWKGYTHVQLIKKPTQSQAPQYVATQNCNDFRMERVVPCTL